MGNRGYMGGRVKRDMSPKWQEHAEVTTIFQCGRMPFKCLRCLTGFDHCPIQDCNVARPHMEHHVCVPRAGSTKPGRPITTGSAATKKVAFRVSTAQRAELDAEAKRLGLSSADVAAKRRTFPTKDGAK